MEASHPENAGGFFATTHWSVVLAANGVDSSQAAAALEELCQTYWYSLYAYIRRRGHGPEDAKDLTQGFLTQLLERQSFARADRHKGRFRSFLLGGLNYYLADQRERARAQKRGGGRQPIPFDTDSAEIRYHREAADHLSPDRLFDRRWALALLDRVLALLEDEFRRAGKAGLFESLRPYLLDHPAEKSKERAAAEMNMSTEAFKKAVQRMRQRYGVLFRQEIARTVAEPTEIEDEMRHLCAIMAE